MNKLFPVSALALAVSGAVGAQAENKLEKVIVTSSRVAMPLREVATSVSVVAAAVLKIRGFNNLSDALRYEPAVSVSNSGGAGATTSLSIRGEYGFRTKVFIDGIEVTDPSTPQATTNFAHLGSGGVERVEILRGSQGMMYGADAGGVVSISTLDTKEGISGSISGEYGRYETQKIAGNLAGGNDTVGFTIYGEDFQTDGFNARTDDVILKDDDGYENTTFHGKAGWNITDTVKAELVGRQVRAENEYDDCFTVDSFLPTNLCHNEYEQDAWRVALSHDGEQFDNRLSYNKHDTDRSFYSEGLLSFGSKGELERTEYLGSWSPSEVTTLVYGVDLISEQIDDGIEKNERDHDGYYLEYQGKFADSFYLTAGARYDDKEDFGSETTYRASAAYLLRAGNGELKFKGAYGTGFRAPSLYEIAYNRGANAYPPASNEVLDAETSKGFDLGLAYYADSGWFVDAVYFDQEVQDEILFDLIEYSGYLQSDGKTTSEGIELMGELPFADAWSIGGNYTYNDTENADGEQRLRSPKHLANLSLKFMPLEQRLKLALHLRMAADIAEEFNSSTGELVTPDDYEVLDFTASYLFGNNLELFGRVENLTDEDYQEVPNYNTAGQALYAGLRFSF